MGNKQEKRYKANTNLFCFLYEVLKSVQSEISYQEKKLENYRGIVQHYLIVQKVN